METRILLFSPAALLRSLETKYRDIADGNQATLPLGDGPEIARWKPSTAI